MTMTTESPDEIRRRDPENPKGHLLGDCPLADTTEHGRRVAQVFIEQDLDAIRSGEREPKPWDDPPGCRCNDWSPEWTI